MKNEHASQTKNYLQHANNSRKEVDSHFHQVHKSLQTIKTHSKTDRGSARQIRQWLQFTAAPKELLQYIFVLLIASATVFSSKIIRAPPLLTTTCKETEKVIGGRVSAHTHTHILLCFSLALNWRTAGNPVLPSK